MKRRSPLTSYLGVLLAIVAVAGCNCDDKQRLKKSGPQIVADPNPIVLNDANVGVTRTRLIKVRNDGTAMLSLSKDPEIINKQGENVDLVLTNKLINDCDGNPRPEGAALLDIAPSACVTINLNYRANSDGAFSATLRFATNQNDLEEGFYDVPINGAALTPHLKACLYDGETELSCSQDGKPFDAVVSASPVGVGTKLSRTLKLIADGTGEVVVSKYTAVGDLDFTVKPGTADFQSTSIASKTSFDFGVDFEPLAGGPRTMTLTFENTDPANQPLVVNLTATADGPALCFCVGNEGSTLCKPMPTADFGTVATGSTGKKFVRLASCGTQPITFTKVEVANTDALPIFGATGLPAVNQVLAPTDNPIEAQLTFSPKAVKQYAGSNGGGRLLIQTSNQKAFIDLIGTGIEGGCKLTAATTTLDFGQGAKGVQTPRILALSNPGGEDCTFPTPANITAGGNVKFEVINYPTMALAPGQTTRVTVGYTPVDTAGPDTGELTIPYADSSGQAASSLKINLKGTPVAVATCKLEALPKANSSYGSTLVFGQVRVNSTKVLPITFKNVGSAACNVTSAKVQAGAFYALTGGDPNAFKIVAKPTAPIAPGDTATVDVSFTPTAEKDYGSPFGQIGSIAAIYAVGVLVNTSDTGTFTGSDCAGYSLGGAATPGCASWMLSGAGARASLQILPGDVDFGLVTVGCQSAEIQVTLYNTGTAPISIKAVRIDPATPAGQTPIFTVIAPTTPFTLAGGAQKKIPVRYRPPDANPHTASLYVESDASNAAIMTVSLKGRGTTESHQTDTFTQNSTPKTDVLFVVDDSGSMGEEQGFLAQNAQAFINEAQKLNTNFQIGVVSTDMTDGKKSGRFQGSTKIVRPGANAASQLSSNISGLGTNGDATERGLDAMVAALTDPLINDPANNAGFLRPDAKLAVVIVSDEEDSSPGSLNFFIDFLKNIKGFANQAMVTMSAIVGDSGNGCTSSSGDAVAGARYIAVQQATGGKFRSICSSNWGLIAQELGLDAFAARAGYQLSRWAVASSIVVKVNGTLQPAGNWTYDPATNTVTFGALYVPAAGATVVIDYDTICY
jgi:hypothetical protein